MFEEGLDMLHILKPNSEPIFCERLLKLMDKGWRKKIVTHEHFYLKNEFKLHGIHLSQRNPEPPAKYRGHVSCSCFSMEEVVRRKPKCDYVFLSQIYDGITKPDFKSSFQELSKELESLLADKEKLAGDDDDVRAKYEDIGDLSEQIETTSMALTEQTYAYAEVLSLLAETNRQLKCFKDEKSKIVKGDDFKKQSTGSGVNVTGETIRLTSADGEGNLRDNEGSGISMTANRVGIAAVEAEGQLKENGQVSITAKNIAVATAGRADADFDDEGTLTKAAYTAEGDFTLKSKNITIESVDYEVADSKFKEKQLTADSKIKLRAKTIEVSTEGSANVEVDDRGQLTKASYTAEGDIIVRSKTFTLESTDNDLENGEAKEKALTAGGQVKVRAPKMEFSGTDTEGKLADGSTMVLASDKMFVGGTSKDVKGKKLQAVSEEMGLFADKTFEAQQGDGKAVVQLDGGNTAVGGSTNAVFGDTTINGKTDIKGDVTAPKATIDNVEAKSSFKSTNIQDGMAAPGAASSASLSAKLQLEDAPKEE